MLTIGPLQAVCKDAKRQTTKLLFCRVIIEIMPSLGNQYTHRKPCLLLNACMSGEFKCLAELGK